MQVSYLRQILLLSDSISVFESLGTKSPSNMQIQNFLFPVNHQENKILKITL